MCVCVCVYVFVCVCVLCCTCFPSSSHHDIHTHVYTCLHTLCPRLTFPTHPHPSNLQILVYGQTGSGKTFTMSSIYERASTDIFAAIDRAGGTKTVSVSFVELAGEKCLDLLNGFNAAPLLTGEDGAVHAYPVVEPMCASPGDLLAMINHGCKIRTTAATGVHDASSRSHAILRIYIQDDDRSTEGVLTLVDLAGSEHRIDSMHHTASRRKEGAEINSSLMALKSCIQARAKGKNLSHQYRSSKLTMALKSSFSLPMAQTVVIATVSPASKDTEHSLNTLRHACLMDDSGSRGGGGGRKRGNGGRRQSKATERSSHIKGGTTTTQQLGSIDVAAEARRRKAGKGPKDALLQSNGNQFGASIGDGGSHAEQQVRSALCAHIVVTLQV